ncbi:uncharacterized protein B0J16DRAFT_186010 [Fusarium flagelliforme]|uniref:uncharacterized protein n=1 Tax=Fusarium flagelliforme TaxID=2675880 RepID=UPI001E8E34CB|nr:uncharacterized protein B0J16DRAFT_186010 [Fusarium flagelliforme]KAH7174914.1 hypothetical protein B0J16DRAFT_186010 [Fusarium flagelliforme]
MPTFPPVDMAIANPEARFPRDQEPGRLSRHALRNLADNDHSHNYPYCWGFTIFRTVYSPDSDEAVAKAVDRLSCYAKHFTDNESMPPRINDPYDPLPNQDLWGRYYSELIEDESILSNASADEAGHVFDNWINANRTPVDYANQRFHCPNGRFCFCLMLDQESIDNILAMPDDPRTPLKLDRQKLLRWVKVVTNETMRDGRRWWLRVSIAEYLWPLWFICFDPDAMIEEMGWVDENDGIQNLWGSPEVVLE